MHKEITQTHPIDEDGGLATSLFKKRQHQLVKQLLNSFCYLKIQYKCSSSPLSTHFNMCFDIIFSFYLELSFSTYTPKSPTVPKQHRLSVIGMWQTPPSRPTESIRDIL